MSRRALIVLGFLVACGGRKQSTPPPQPTPVDAGTSVDAKPVVVVPDAGPRCAAAVPRSVVPSKFPGVSVSKPELAQAKRVVHRWLMANVHNYKGQLSIAKLFAPTGRTQADLRVIKWTQNRYLAAMSSEHGNCCGRNVMVFLLDGQFRVSRYASVGGMVTGAGEGGTINFLGVGDLNRDGRPELWVRWSWRRSGDHFRLRLRSSAGLSAWAAFELPTLQPEASFSSSSPRTRRGAVECSGYETGDFNCDGVLELRWAGCHKPMFRWDKTKRRWVK